MRLPGPWAGCPGVKGGRVLPICHACVAKGVPPPGPEDMGHWVPLGAAQAQVKCKKDTPRRARHTHAALGASVSVPNGGRRCDKAIVMRLGDSHCEIERSANVNESLKNQL